jgi:hypothetical protein
MPVNTNFVVAGVADAVRQLNTIEPKLRKKFEAEISDIAEPALSQARQAYRFVPLSGLERKWAGPAVRGRQVAPLTLEKARDGLKVKLDTRRKATSTILIQQTDPGWAIFETAGRKTSNRLGDSLGPLGSGKTRLFGRVVYAVKPQIEEKVAKHTLKVVNAVNTNMRTR